MAPIQAAEPGLRGARPIDAVDSGRTVTRQQPLDAPASPPAASPDPTPAPTPDAIPESVRYEAALDQARVAASASGITFAVVRDGELVWTGSSGRDRSGRTELAPESSLVIGSVTKTFVASVVLELAGEGRIDLSDRVATLLPEFEELSGEVTVAQLLDHTSGLADVFNDTTRIGLEEDPARAWTAAEVLGTIHTPWYAPGKGWAYANTNYYLLGLIVERVTGNTLEVELERRILGPLDLGATVMLEPSDAAGPLAPAWSSIFWASGAMVSSAADLARWGDALYGGGVLPDAARDAMLDFNGHDYGFGVQRLALGSAKGYGHTGLLNTYTSLLFHVPQRDVTIALLVNRSHVDLGGMLTAEPPDGPSLLELALGQ